MFSYTQFMEVASLGESATFAQKVKARDSSISILKEISMHSKHINIPLEEGLTLVFAKEELTNLFNAVNRCKCCPRHMSKKPVAIDSDEETPTQQDQGSGCKCGCRHSARFFKRGFDLLEMDSETVSAVSDSDDETIPYSSSDEESSKI
jgi:hypothetical protein